MLIMSSEAIDEVKNEEVAEIDNSKVIEETNEEQPTEQIKEEDKTIEPIEKIKEETTKPIEQPKAKATPKKLARSFKVVELVECSARNKKMLPKSLRNTHPYYCKGQPTETLPVNKQKASYGAKVEEKLRKEIEEEIKKTYETKEVIQHSEPIEVKAKQQPIIVKPPHEVSRSIREPPKQLTATELIQQSYNEMKRLRQQEKQEKITSFKTKMF